MKEILLKIYEILNSGLSFIPECGADFKPDDCEGCQVCDHFNTCKHESKRQQDLKDLKQMIDEDLHLY